MVRIASDNYGDGYITAKTYASKYGTTPEAVRAACRRGSLPGYSNAKGGGAAGGEWVFVLDTPAKMARLDSPYRGDRKRCSACMTWLSRSSYATSQWDRPKAPCRMCNSLMWSRKKGQYDRVDALVDASSKAAEVERQHVLTDRQRSERELRVAQHAARIEAAGLAGDGEGWPDE